MFPFIGKKNLLCVFKRTNYVHFNWRRRNASSMLKGGMSKIYMSRKPWNLEWNSAILSRKECHISYIKWVLNIIQVFSPHFSFVFAKVRFVHHSMAFMDYQKTLYMIAMIKIKLSVNVIILLPIVPVKLADIIKTKNFHAKKSD